MNDLVVVLLLNYNQNDYTIKCLESLLKSNYEDYKIILVDNGSTKENVAELEENIPIDKKLIFKKLDPNIGFAMGYNYALEEGRKLNPRYFLLMNNDTIIDKSAIVELVKTCQQYNDKARVIGKVYHYDDPKRLQIVGNQYVDKKMLMYKTMGSDEVDNGQFDKVEERDMVDDVYTLHPAELYDRIGGYSPYFWINGVEKDLSLRAIKEGYKLVYTPEAKLWHKGSVSFGGRKMNPKIAYYSIQSKLILRYLHLSKSSFLIFYLNVFKSVLGTLFKSIYYKMFKGKDITKYARAKLGGFIYFNKWLFKRNMNNGHNPYSN